MKRNRFFLKLTTVFFSTVILLFTFGCSKNQNGITLDEVGIFLPLDESYEEKGLDVQQVGNTMSHFPCAMITFSDQAKIDEILDDAEKNWNSLPEGEEQENFLNELYANLSVHQKLIAQILVIPEDEYEELLNPENEDSDIISGFTILGKKYGNVYLYDLPETDSEGMDEEEKARFEECSAAVKKAIKHAKMTEIKDAMDIEESVEDFSNPTIETDSSLSFIPDFESVDLNGNTVTKEIFKGKKLTVVNVWGTFCGPCIQEMPELAEWSKSMPSDVQLLGIVCDISSEKDAGGIEEAQSILQQAGADFTNILASGEVANFIAGFQYVPTTFLVDSEGNVVSEPIVGAQVEKYKATVKDWLGEN